MNKRKRKRTKLEIKYRLDTVFQIAKYDQSFADGFRLMWMTFIVWKNIVFSTDPKDNRIWMFWLCLRLSYKYLY